MVRSVAQRRVSNHGPLAGRRAAPHGPPSSFETPVVAVRRQAPQDEGGVRKERNAKSGVYRAYFASTGSRADCGKYFSIFGSTPFFFISSSQIRWMR
jgi:hypothetical protein